MLKKMHYIKLHGKLIDNFKQDDPYSNCPFGICAGSEKQGGLHETGFAPIQVSCSHMTTLTVDGQNRDLVNYWQHIELHAGDVLVFRKKTMRVQNFVLNHYYKGIVTQNFKQSFEVEQWVPDVMRNTVSYYQRQPEAQLPCHPTVMLAFKDFGG